MAKDVEITSNETSGPLSLLRVHEVAAMLSVSVRSVWRQSSAGLLPRPISIGRSKRWRRREVEGFVASRTH